MIFNVRRHIWLLVLIVVCLLAPSVLLAQEPGASDDDVNAIAEQLYCPVCENILLDVCATAACEQWRDEIRFQLDEGWTEAQIINDFVDRFGDRVVGTPKDPALRALSLVTPWIMGLLVLGGGIFTFIRWRGIRQTRTGFTPAPASSPGNVHMEDDYRSQLEQDLRARS